MKEASHQPAPVTRRAFLIGLAFATGVLIDTVWARLVRGVRLEREDYPKFVLGQFRVHHNVVGYLSIVAGLFMYPALLIPLGLGMIVGHARRDRLIWFVERVPAPPGGPGGTSTVD